MNLTLLMAITADGKIAKNSSQPANWTSPEDKKAFVEITKEAGVLIMGDSTFNTIGKPLPGRLNIVLTPEPDASKNIAGLLEYTNSAPQELLKNLEERGFTKAILGGGAYTNKTFWELGLVNEVILTIEPLIFGQGLSFLADNDFSANLKLMDMKKLNDNTIQLHYEVMK